MNRTELVKAIAQRTGQKNKDITFFLEALASVILEEVRADRKVKVTGFGIFQSRRLAARMARNPKTDERVAVPARRGLGFSASEAWKNFQ